MLLKFNKKLFIYIRVIKGIKNKKYLIKFYLKKFSL